MPEKEWKNKIIRLEKQANKEKKAAKAELKKALVNAVIKNIPKKRFGILFSGGVDSTLIAYLCKKQKANFICYSVGLENSPDLVWAREIAKKYNLKLKTKTFKFKDMEKLFKKTKKALLKADTLSMGVGAVLLSAIELGKKDRISDFFTGLGSEEIFAGYHYHEEAKDANKECWKRLKSMWARDFKRDFAVAKKMKINLLVPFLDEELIKTAMKIPSKKKIDKKNKKIILRQVAQDLGLQKTFAWRSKKAAQYGSWFDKCLSRLARQKGYIFKQDYINSL